MAIDRSLVSGSMGMLILRLLSAFRSNLIIFPDFPQHFLLIGIEELFFLQTVKQWIQRSHFQLKYIF